MNELQTSIFMSLLPVHLGRGYSPGESAQMAMAGIREIEAVINAEFPDMEISGIQEIEAAINVESSKKSKLAPKV